ncbi:hypothetical protein LOD99_6918 [Oopsacas minuta]|uniref:Uncharacterized protein n=1 Tax=Oopsacas minuta TaxID=111878 RepID=A0AAV7JJE9_9METZ|nr:hypothetical protein LOD99_6918 [Oopsacas minuta]
MTVNHTPIFKIPIGPPHIVSQWKQFLHRECIEEIKKIYLCLKHFREEDIEFFFSIPQPDGSILQEKRSLPRLCSLAVPCFCPVVPVTYPTQPNVHVLRQLVLGFEELKSKLVRISLPKQWILWPTDENQLHFIQPAISDVTGAHYIEPSLSINDSFSTKRFSNNKEIYQYIKQITDIRDIDNLLEEISSIGIENHRQELSTPTFNQQSSSDQTIASNS